MILPFSTLTFSVRHAFDCRPVVYQGSASRSVKMQGGIKKIEQGHQRKQTPRFRRPPSNLIIRLKLRNPHQIRKSLNVEIRLQRSVKKTNGYGKRKKIEEIKRMAKNS